MSDPESRGAERVAVHCQHLLDPAAGALRGESTVVIAGGRIEDVVTGPARPAGASVIELPPDATCLPGLIDSHTHITLEFDRSAYSDKFRLNPADYVLRGAVYARRTLLAGFTSVRNVGDFANESLALRNAINAGWLAGPRIFSAGKFIGTTGGHVDPTDGVCWALQGDPAPKDGIINSTADAWKAVRQHYKDGADLLKLMASGGVLDESGSSSNSQVTLDEASAVVAAAHDYGFTVAVHAHGAEAIRRSVMAGVDSIEHGTFIDDATIALMLERGTWFVPTLIAGQTVMERAREGGWFPPQVSRKALEIGPKMLATTARVHRAGVRIAFGTDAGVFSHGINAREFAYLVEAGLSPMEAIQSATIGSARLLRREPELGCLAAGAHADLIAVAGNPLDDVTRLQHVDFVMRDGIVYKQGGEPAAGMLAA